MAGRLALPWPFRAITDRWLSDDNVSTAPLADLLPNATDYVLVMGTLFLAIVLLLGLFDLLERFQFARFAIGTVRDIRAKAFWSAVRVRGQEGRPPQHLTEIDLERFLSSRNQPAPPPGHPQHTMALGGREGERAGADSAIAENALADAEEEDEFREPSANSGDLVARLVGDTARLKSGMQGFLVHVATNSVVFLGVTIVLFTMDPKLGLVFAAAGVATAVVTLWAGRRMFRRALKQRQREGKLADQIQDALGRDPSDEAFAAINESSGQHEAAQTQIQGFASWSAHIFFGLAVVAALWVGTQGVEAGRVSVGDMLVLMMYALMMRGPIVRLARQGSKTGKILGAMERLVQVLDAAPAAESRVANGSLMPLRESLRIDHLTARILRGGEGSLRLGPISVEIPAGEKLAIVGEAGAGKTALLEIINGARQAEMGRVLWDGSNILETLPEKRARQIAHAPQEASGEIDSTKVERRLLGLIRLICRDASLWLFDAPTDGLPEATADGLLAALLNTKKSSTVIVATSRPIGIERFDRLLHLHKGRVIYDGPPAKWPRPLWAEKASTSSCKPPIQAPAVTAI